MRILIVEDETPFARVLERLIAAEGLGETVVAASAEQALVELHREPVDLVLTDLRLPGGSGLDLLDEVRERMPDVAVALMTAHADVATAQAALRGGALDYLVKPFEDAELLDLVRGVAARRPPAGERLHGLLWGSPAMERVAGELRQAAASDALVLLLGESGTGKEVAARALHRLSARRDGPFVDVHVAALSESVLESELFGHEQGAFTGADERRAGFFESAAQGSLFLDEIGEIPLHIQPKLLRVLEDRSFYRVGGRERLDLDARLIAATNRDLRAEVAAGRFREDLFYRLDVLTIELPPLRERDGDAVLLARHFLSAHRGDACFADETLALIGAHTWPGNVRELANAVERAALVAPGDVIEPEHLPPRLLRETRPEADTAELRASLDHEDHERRLITAALETAEGNRTRAAELLGISRRRLYSRLQRLGLDR